MSGKVFRLLCPVDPSHGPLLGLTDTTRRGEGWYCPNQEHDGSKDRPASRPFFTTAAAEAAAKAAR